MTLRASLLGELANPNLSAGRRAELCCELARDFENRGEYEKPAKCYQFSGSVLVNVPTLKAWDGALPPKCFCEWEC